MSPIVHHLRACLVYFSVTIFLPVLWFPFYIYKRFILLLVQWTRSDLGKTFNDVDIVLEESGLQEEGAIYIPKSSLVNSVALKGSLSIEDFRELFKRNVLERTTASAATLLTRKLLNNNNNNYNDKVIRYPELTQYPVSFMGYSFWKQVPNFRLEDHILEKDYGTEQPSLSLLHEYFLNKPYKPKRSPWELMVIKNDNTSNPSTLIIARFHHSIADAKSILKLFVECLGDQPLKTAKAQGRNSLGIVDTIAAPLHLALLSCDLVMKTIRFWNHPWKANKTTRKINDLAPQLVRISPKLCLSDIKAIGKQTGGTTASVILAIISGAIKTVKPDMGKLYSVYILPTEDHPETLGNHAGFGAVVLPCSEECPSKRLKECHEIFRKLKAADMERHLAKPLFALASLCNPLRGVFARELMSTSPMGITNIAGEGNGFSVGKLQCTEFIFSVGTLLGDTGVVFCVSSYKDYIRIAVISKGGILTESTSEFIANIMEKELHTLRQLI